MLLVLSAGVLSAPTGEAIPELAYVATSSVLNASADTSHTLAYAMTNGSGSYRALVLGAGSEGTPTFTLDAASYNSVAGDLEASVTDNEAGGENPLYVWTWIGGQLPADTSSHDIVVTPSVSARLAMAAIEYNGVANAPAESVDTSNVDPPDDMVVTSTEGALVVHFLNSSQNGLGVTEDNSQNQRVEANANNASITLWAGDLIGVSAGSVTSGVTLSGGAPRCAQVCISLAKAA